MRGKGHLLIITGPSCAGKSPLVVALQRLYAEWRHQVRPLVLFNSRSARPGEEEGTAYHFRTREAIAAMASQPDRVVMDVRGDLQALDLRQLEADLAKDDVLFEGNPFIAQILQTDDRLSNIPRRSLFVSPVSAEEIKAFREFGDPAALVTEVMRRKLLRRTRRQKGEISLPDLEDVERRAGSAWKELKMASLFDRVVVNHDGEDSENWDAFPVPIGDARRTVQAVWNYFDTGTTEDMEQWPETLFETRQSPS